jgi:hypothetical protein
MSLDLPTPTVTLGPEWAEQLNAALEFIDAHDHTAGKGRPITSAALNINADLPLNTSNLLNARSYNFQNLGGPIAGPADIRSLYVANGELYYNDGDGVQIQLTDNGGLNASTIGGIGGDYGPPAAVNYNSISKAYLFYQNSTTGLRAKLDTADILLRDDVVGANAITLKSPTSLAAPYDFRFPNALPLQDSVLRISPTGDVDPVLVTDPLLAVDAVTNTKIIANAVTTTKIADDNVTAAKIAPAANVATLVRESFTASGTFTKPAGMLGDLVVIRGFGGGGGGAGGSSPSGTSGGGGAGSLEKVVALKLAAASTSFSVTVGVGGTAGIVGSSGGSGGDSIFTDTTASTELYRWTGGAGGTVGGPSGGSSSFSTMATLRDANVPGGTGGSTNANGAGSSYLNVLAQSKPFVGGTSETFIGNGRAGGGGGAGPEGNGGRGGTGDTPAGPPNTWTGTGTAGFTPPTANSGAGGGGGSSTLSASSFAGAAGSAGLVEIWYWVNVNP